MKSKRLADTGLLVALLDGKDDHHLWAVGQAKICETGFITCKAVLSEAFFRLRRSQRGFVGLLAMLESGWLKIVPVMTDLQRNFARVLEDYHPRADFADACLVALHELTGARVWTTDRRDFTVYRTRAGAPVPVCLPPLPA